MAALALQNIGPENYYIRLDLEAVQNGTDYDLLLDAILDQTESQTGTIYSFEPETLELNAVAVRASVEPHLNNVGTTLSRDTTRWLLSLACAVHGRPASEPNFSRFPETLQYRVERLAIVPLRSENNLFGLLTVGRTTETPFDSAPLEFVQRAGRLLTALLERDTLRQKLAERKLVERAKGILQQRRRLSEEQAYLLLRNSSRSRRIPMANLAKEIIEGSVTPVEIAQRFVDTRQEPRWRAAQ
jgi:GAF domain-containing protein